MNLKALVTQGGEAAAYVLSAAVRDHGYACDATFLGVRHSAFRPRTIFNPKETENDLQS